MYLRRTEGNPAWHGGAFPVTPCYKCPLQEECGMRMWRYKENACGAYTAFRNIEEFQEAFLERYGDVEWRLDIFGLEAVQTTKRQCRGYCYWVYRNAEGRPIFQAEAVLPDMVTVSFWDLQDAMEVLPEFYAGQPAQWSREVDHPEMDICLQNDEAGFIL